VLSDALSLGAAFYLGYRLYVLTAGQEQVAVPPFSAFGPMLAVQVITIILIFFFSRLYDIKRSLSRLDEFYSVFAATSIGVIVTIAFTSLFFRESQAMADYPRFLVVYAWLLSVVLETLSRGVLTLVRNALRRRGLLADHLLIVGTGDVGRMILQKARQTPGLGYEAVGFVDPHNGAEGVIMGLPVLGGTEDLPRIIDEHHVEEVILGLPEASHQELLSIISLCERGKVGIKVFPDLFQIIASEISIGDLAGLPLLNIRDVALRGWKLTLKRAVDLAGGVIVLVVVSPLMLLTAILIKLDSPGPVFYVQERMGLDARPFWCLKFRSMRTDAEKDGPGWTSEQDPRVTRLGRLIRRLSLDELPQLINVLVGDMSLVGPRPERPVYVEQFRTSIPRYMDRHREKAGMTGWAQVNGLRGDTSISERTKYDLWYIENWSLSLDFKIMVRTLGRLFSDPHAY
jgi:Undecaprenyl-phosphate glucose phosphotransferase